MGVPTILFKRRLFFLPFLPCANFRAFFASFFSNINFILEAEFSPLLSTLKELWVFKKELKGRYCEEMQRSRICWGDVSPHVTFEGRSSLDKSPLSCFSWPKTDLINLNNNSLPQQKGILYVHSWRRLRFGGKTWGALPTLRSISHETRSQLEMSIRSIFLKLFNSILWF